MSDWVLNSQAFFVYFATNNLFTLFQIWFFKQPAVRKYFKIPNIIRYTIPGEHANPGNRMASFADAWRLIGNVDKKLAAGPAAAIKAK
jgi:membrane protein insertase Oxa1/YidC/SpoIIIJ